MKPIYKSTLMKKQFFTLIVGLLFFQNYSTGQTSASQAKYLFHKINKQNSFNLKEGKGIDVYLLDSITKVGNNLYEFKSKHYLGGSFKELNDSSFVFIKNYEELEISNLDSSFQQTIRFPKEEITYLPIDKIKYIEYYQNGGDIFNAIGGISLLSAIIIAPLVSINYSKGTFNSDRYFSIVKPSLIGLAIGLPLSYPFTSKRLVIKPIR